MKFDKAAHLKEEWKSEGNVDKLINTLRQALRPGNKIKLDAEMDIKGNVKFRLKD